MKQNVIFGKGQTSPSGKITAENSGLTGKVVFFDQNDYEGLNSEYDYLFGGRSFTVYCVDGSGMKEVYTSGNELRRQKQRHISRSTLIVPMTPQKQMTVQGKRAQKQKA